MGARQEHHFVVGFIGVPDIISLKLESISFKVIPFVAIYSRHSPEPAAFVWRPLPSPIHCSHLRRRAKAPIPVLDICKLTSTMTLPTVVITAVKSTLRSISCGSMNVRHAYLPNGILPTSSKNRKRIGRVGRGKGRTTGGTKGMGRAPQRERQEM